MYTTAGRSWGPNHFAPFLPNILAEWDSNRQLKDPVPMQSESPEMVRPDVVAKGQNPPSPDTSESFPVTQSQSRSTLFLSTSFPGNTIGRLSPSYQLKSA